MRARFVADGYRLAWWVVRRLPLRLVSALGNLAADIAARRGGRGVQRLRENLARVAPSADLDALTRAALRSYARYWIEVFRLPGLSTDQVVGRMRILHDERIRDGYASGRGLILALPHMANWDHAGAWLVASGVPFTTVAERLRPEALFDQFVAFREGLGMHVVPLTGGASSPSDHLRQVLTAGGALCLVADRDLSESGIPVQFFGETATMPAGPALLAVRTGAVLLPVTLWWDDPRPGSPLTAHIHEEVVDPGTGSLTDRVSAMTQALADAFARDIAEHPQDWHMLARLWRADRGSGRAAA
jgi:KDO2-lipid IV(A) lauroyltransferase